MFVILSVDLNPVSECACTTQSPAWDTAVISVNTSTPQCLLWKECVGPEEEVVQEEPVHLFCSGYRGTVQGAESVPLAQGMSSAILAMCLWESSKMIFINPPKNKLNDVFILTKIVYWLMSDVRDIIKEMTEAQKPIICFNTRKRISQSRVAPADEIHDTGFLPGLKKS